jgi:hypothetical protein
MDPEVLAGKAGGAPCGGGVIKDAGVGVNPIPAALEVCRIEAAARNAFIQVKGIDSLKAFGTLSGDSDVTDMVERTASCMVNVWSVILGIMQIKRVQALVFWDKDHEKRQVNADELCWLCNRDL